MTSPLPPPPVAAQLTEKVVVVVPPDGTVTVRGFAPLTLQFDATPDSASAWAHAGPVNVTLAFVAIGWLIEPPSTVTVYPSGSRSEPVVLAVTVRLPVCGGGAAQLTAKLAVAVPPEGTVAVCGLAPLTEQFAATP